MRNSKTTSAFWHLSLLWLVFCASLWAGSAHALTTTSTTLTSSVNPATTGQNTVLTAKVSPTSATGTVTFKDGTTTLGTGTLSSGVATLTKSFSTSGAHSLTVVYGGSSTHAASTSAALSQTVNLTSSTTALASSANPTKVGQSTVLTATITPSTATGTVTFKDGTATLGTGAVSSGKATLTTTFSTTGAHSLTAVYGGSSAHATSTSAALAETVNIGTTTTALSSSVNPATVGQSTTLTATVTPSAATGTVTFKDGTTTLGTGTLSAGVATLAKSFSTTGVHSLTAVYGGTANYGGSTSPALSENVNPAAATSTTTALASSVNPSSVGQNTTLNATVTPSAATGTVTFKDGTTTLGTGTISAGVASLSTSFATAGSHSITAAYGGATGFAASTSAALTQSVRAATTTSLSSSVNPSLTAQATVLKALVLPASATGTVTFKDGATVLGSAALSSGQATLSQTFTVAGVHSLTAIYAGDASNGGSTSAALTQNVTAASALPAPPVSPAPVAAYNYDAQGNLTQVVVAPAAPGLGLTSNLAYDGLNRTKTLTDANSGTVQLGYSAQDRITQVVDPRQLVTQTPRNGFGEVKQVQSPDTGSAAHTFDAAGNLLTRTDSRGVLASYSYDALNRMTAAGLTKSGQPAQNYTWVYDQTGGSNSNGIGRLTTINFPEGNTSYGYDPQGRLILSRQTLTPNATANPLALVQYTSYGYDGAGNLTSLTYPSGRVLTVSYTNGLPSSLGLAGSSLLTNLKYTGTGVPKSWNWAVASGNGAHERSFDTNGRLVRYPLGDLLRDLTYDAAGRIASYTHYVAATGLPATAEDQQFSYDALNRLTQVSTAAGPRSYSYDANGNRTSVVVNNGTPNVYTVDSASNRLKAISTPPTTLTQDAAGNMISDGTFSLGYDLRGRLTTSSRAGTTTTYSYDNAGRRMRKYDSTGASSTTVFAYSPQGRLLGEYDSAGKAIREYVWLGNLPIAVFTPDPVNAANPPKVYFIQADHLNTPRVVVDTGNVMRWRWLAEPFGTTAPQTSPAGQAAFTFNLRFSGQFFDAESGMHYNMNRDYIPAFGAYAQSDPIGLDGGINTYAYVGGNPLSLADPLGFTPKGLPRNPLELMPLEGGGGPGVGGPTTSGRSPFGPKTSAPQCPPGYDRLVKDPPFNPHGQKVFTDGKNYITPDVDQHKGGVWKMFDRRGNRTGTYDADLNKIGK